MFKMRRHAADQCLQKSSQRYSFLKSCASICASLFSLSFFPLSLSQHKKPQNWGIFQHRDPKSLFSAEETPRKKWNPPKKTYSVPTFFCHFYLFSLFLRQKGATLRGRCHSFVHSLGLFYRPPKIGRCPSTVRPVFPVLVFQLSKQQNHTQTTSTVHRTLRTVLGQRHSP